MLEARGDALRIELDVIAVELDELPEREPEAPAEPTPEDDARFLRQARRELDDDSRTAPPSPDPVRAAEAMRDLRVTDRARARPVQLMPHAL